MMIAPLLLLAAASAQPAPQPQPTDHTRREDGKHASARPQSRAMMAAVANGTHLRHRRFPY